MAENTSPGENEYLDANKDTVRREILTTTNKRQSQISFDDVSYIDDDDYAMEGACHNCKRSRACYIFTYLWIFLMMLVSLTATVVVGIVIAAPYQNVNHFRATSCTLQEISHSPSTFKCSCGKRCDSGYTCLIIHVGVKVLRSNQTRNQIWEDESALGRKVSMPL